MDVEEVSNTMKNAKSSSGKNSTIRYRNIVAFYILGFANSFGFLIMTSAANDILKLRFNNNNIEIEDSSSNTTIIPELENNSRKCNELSTGAILLANILPGLTIKLVGSFLPFYIHVRFTAVVLSSVFSFICVALSTTKFTTILGVALSSMSGGLRLAEISSLAYLHKFDKKLIGVWTSGTGTCGLVASISYTALISIMSIESTLLTMIIVPTIQALAFWLILVHPSKQLEIIVIDNNNNQNQEKIIKLPKKTIREKLSLIPRLLPYAIPLGCVFFFEFFINMGLFEFIQFDNIWLSHAEQYRWLQVGYQIGSFISRSSTGIIRFTRIWIMALLQFLNAVFFGAEVIFYFLPSVWIPLACSIWEGLLGGGAYVNTLYNIREEVPADDLRDSLAIITTADSIGVTIASFVSMAGHSVICKLPRPIR